MNLIRHELYKIFSQKIIHIAFILFTLLYTLSFFDTKESSLEIQKQRDAYDRYGGPLTEQKIRWANETKGKWTHHQETIKESSSIPQNTPATGSELLSQYQIAMDIHNLIMIRNSYYELNVQQLEEQVSKLREESRSDYSYTKTLKELGVWKSSSGPSFIVYQQGWSNILQYISQVGYFFAAALIVIGLSSSMSGEYTSRMDHLIFSSRYGRSEFVWAKMMAALVYSMVTVIFLNATVFLLNSYYYGLSGWNIPLNNFHHLYGYTSFNGPIWLYYVMQQLYAMLGCTVLSLFVILLSTLSRHIVIPSFIAGSVFMIPVIASFINIHVPPLQWLIGHIFRFTEFIQLGRLGNPSFSNFFGYPLIYDVSLLAAMILFIFTLGLLTYLSIRNRQVT